jgi:hypothetical protein
MTTWVRKQFSDVEHARTAVLAAALAIGSIGFLVAMAALIAH